VRFWSRAAGATAEEAEAAMNRLGLAGRLADVPVARLSAGQRRRAAVAVLVARRPELWLLDEPHAGLDAAGRDLVDTIVRDAVAVVLSVQRAFAIESADGNRDALRLSGLDPAGIFLGKAAAIALQLAGLEVLLGVGIVVLYGSDIQNWPLLVGTCVAATVGLA